MLLKIGFFAALGGFLYGYDLGLIGGALFNIRDEFQLSQLEEEWVVGSAKIGAFFGTFLGGAMMLHYGRRKTIAIDSLFYMAGPLIMAFAYSMTTLVLGRFMVGIGIGISAVVVPVYLGEVAPAQVRGRLVLLYELLLCGGMLCSLLADVALMHLPNNWRWMVGLPVLPAAVLAVSLFILPESPRWLVVNGHLDSALAVIHRVFTRSVLPTGTHNSTAEVEHELMDLWSAVEKDRVLQANRKAAATRSRTRQDPSQPPLKKATRLFGKPGQKFHTLQHPVDDNPHMDVPKELEERHAVLPDQANESHHMPDGHMSAQGQQLPDQATGQTMHQQAVLDQALQDPLLTQQEGQQAHAGAPHQPPHAEADIRTQSQEVLSIEQRGGQTSSMSPRTEEGPGLPLEQGTWHRPYDDDPVSPASSSGSALDPHLFRSLSEVPKGLRPIRTTSGRVVAGGGQDAASLKGFVARLKWARQQSLQQRQSQQQQNPAQATSVQGEQAGFWHTLWAMLLDIYVVLTGPERRAVRIALWLAFFDQGCASTAIINYAPEVLEIAGVTDYGDATLWSSAITASKIVGVSLSIYLIDTAGRRPLLIFGGSSAALAMVLLAAADYMVNPVLVVCSMCIFIASFSLSYAGVFWVLISEIFSMSTKSPAAAAASAMLFLAGAAANLVFLSLHRWLGSASFLVFGAVAASGAVYCYLNVPETMGKTLAEVQVLLGSELRPGDAAVTSVEGLPRPLTAGQAASQLQLQQQAQTDSRLESGLLLSNSVARSGDEHELARAPLRQSGDVLTFADRLAKP